MKRILSVMLAVALVLTTLALPMSAFAAEGTITISYADDVNGSAHPSDEVNVTVQLAHTATADLATVEIPVYYDDAILDLTGVKGGDSFTTVDYQENADGEIVLVWEDLDGTGVALSATAVNFATLTFKVLESVTGVRSNVISLGQDSYAAIMGYVAGFPSEIYSVADNNITETPYGIEIVANEITAKVTPKSTGTQADLADMKYFDTAGLDIAISGTHLTKYVLSTDGVAGGEVTISDNAAAIELTEPASYVLTVYAAGTSKVYTFSLETANVDAKLVIDETNIADAYTFNGLVEIPVKITGLDTAAAAMITFDVAYDADFYSSVTVETETGLPTATIENGTVKIGLDDGTTQIPTDSTVATVKLALPATDNGYTFGLKTITLSNPNVALYNETANPTDTDVQFTKDKVEYTFYPAEDFVTVDDSTQTTVTNKDYDLTVTSAKGATVKYIAVSDLTGIADGATDEEIAKSIIDGTVATAPVDGKMTVSKEGKYYVAAQIGTKYDLVEVTSMIDKTAPAKPVITGLATESWVAAPKTYDFANTSTSDDVASYKYALVAKDATPGESDWVVGSSLTVAESTDKELYVVAVDAAGNESAASEKLAVTVDAEAPTAVTATAANAMNADGTWTVNVVVTGDVEGYSDLTVEVWKKGASEKLAVVTDGSYNVAETGTYIFKAYDEAHKDADVESAEVVITLGSAVVNGVEALVITPAGEITEYAGNLVDTKAIEGLDNNGSFTYVAYNVKAADTNFENEVTLTKDDVAVEGAGETGVVTEAGNYVLTVTTKHATNDAIEAATKTYKFSIVAADDIPSINNDERWNIIDYTMIKWLVDKDTANTLPTADYGFTGGIFAGDVNGSLSYDAADYGLIINAIKAGLRIGEYTFPVMNKPAAN